MTQFCLGKKVETRVSNERMTLYRRHKAKAMCLPKIRVPLLVECQQQFLENHQRSLLNPHQIRSLGIAIILYDSYFNQILSTFDASLLR